METMLKLARIRYPYNQGSLGSIYKAEGRLHEVENMLLTTNNNMIQKNIRLNSLMNISGETRYRIDTGMQVLTPVLTPLLTTESLLGTVDTTYLLQNRSDLQIGRASCRERVCQ